MNKTLVVFGITVLLIHINSFMVFNIYDNSYCRDKNRSCDTYYTSVAKLKTLASENPNNNSKQSVLEHNLDFICKSPKTIDYIKNVNIAVIVLSVLCLISLIVLGIRYGYTEGKYMFVAIIIFYFLLNTFNMSASVSINNNCSKFECEKDIDTIKTHTENNIKYKKNSCNHSSISETPYNLIITTGVFNALSIIIGIIYIVFSTMSD